MIHPTAIIDPAARLAPDVEVGPYSIIGADVEIGAGTVVGPHVVIKGPTTIGARNRIFQFASVGEDPQDKKFAGEPTRLVIGDDNQIREYVSIHRGTVQDQGLTRIGSRNLLMTSVHIAHDVVMGDDCIVATGTGVAGHVHIGDSVILGGMTGVHQFCRIGSYAMTAGCSLVVKDIPAYVMVGGNPATAYAMNFEGMRRRGWSSETINTLKKAYRIVYRDKLTLEAAVTEAEKLVAECPEVQLFIDSLKASTRGIVR
ncbi:MAG TPA: acyl-ACP--UDP-N-acetylglucosamine O-acyltransferase [Moraxellaceae bacterium]|nr:acyl-ACP--UDP-N-acetylglucosamine O-acyltransferase [Moraxellaceae bacterium]